MRMVFPEWNLLRQYLRSIWMVPLPLRERARCMLTLAKWARRNTPKLARDILYAAEHLVVQVATRAK